MTKSSVNFKAVKSAGHAVSHASREIAPTYLLASDKSMGTIVLLDDKGEVAETLDAKLALASRQALREKGYSPVWEGVLNLPRPEVGFDADEYKKTCTTIVSSWCEKYQASTGHKVLRADIHLDEGHMVDGEVLLNAHAHIIADRTNEKGRVMQLSPKMLRELQSLTAQVTGLERGKSSFETGRKHIDHQAYKYLAELGRLETQQQLGVQKSTMEMYGRLLDTQNNRVEKSQAKVKDLQAHLDQEPARIAAALKDQEEGYRLQREAMKASGTATQKDYQDLRKANEVALAEEIKKLKEKVAEMEKKIETQDIELDEVKAEYAAMAHEYQAHLAAGLKGGDFVPGAGPDPLLSLSNNQAVEVFLAKHQDVPEATAREVEHGVVMETCGSHALVHMGRGKNLLHNFGTAQSVPRVGTTVGKSGAKKER